MTARVGWVALALFVGTVLAANWLVQHVGIVSVGFGLMAPAGVYAVGVAFTLRDVVHRTLGGRYALAGIAAGCGLSLVVSSDLAMASALAFVASELVDLAVFEGLGGRSVTAVASSNIAGLVTDSVVFLVVAFGSLEFLVGQIVGKAWMTVAAVPLIVGSRAVLSRYA
jgi:uncharacterized PurR-regulated membrane protein YhhQ (DUF165 family)